MKNVVVLAILVFLSFLLVGCEEQIILISNSMETYYKPIAIYNITGNVLGNVDNVSNFDDDKILVINEIVGTPGFDIRFNFTNVTNFNYVHVRYYYVGSINHYYQLQLWNYRTWTNLESEQGDNADLYLDKTYHIPQFNDTKYINNGNVILRMVHPVMGVGTHNVYVDYVSLEYKI